MNEAVSKASKIRREISLSLIKYLVLHLDSKFHPSETQPKNKEERKPFTGML